MGTKQIHVSGELWQQICTVGNPLVHGLECTKGLPEGATFCGVSYKRHGFQSKPLFAAVERPEFPNIIIFIFEHPDWPEIEPGEDAPVLDVVWEREEAAYGYKGID